MAFDSRMTFLKGNICEIWYGGYMGILSGLLNQPGIQVPWLLTNLDTGGFLIGDTARYGILPRFYGSFVP